MVNIFSRILKNFLVSILMKPNMFDPIYNITIGIVRVREVNTNS